MTKTFKELQEVDILVGGLYQANPKLKDSKFGYAYKKFTDKNYLPTAREFNDELGALRVQYALEDPVTKEVLTDRMSPRGFKYSKAGLTDLMREEKKLQEKWDAKEIEIVPFICSSVPEEIDEEKASVLAGLVL